MPNKARSQRDARARMETKVKALNKASELIRSGAAQGDQLSRMSTETLMQTVQDASGQPRHTGLVNQIKEILTTRQ